MPAVASTRFITVLIILMQGYAFAVNLFLFYLKNMWAWAANPQGTEEDFRAGYRPYVWTWMVGLGLCCFSWSWSLATTITLIRSAPGFERRREIIEGAASIP